MSSSWTDSFIDAFLLSKMRSHGLEPSSEAGREHLLRRVCLDLTGLPPTPDQAAEFLADRSPRAYERLVESLLASPHYGERWAQKWLDVVRFADTDGFEQDGYREHGWRYRDYVVRSFNQDKPYDRFVQEQIAGDELLPGNSDALVATGFHGAGPRHVVGGNQDKEEARQEVLTEMTLGVGQAMLGLTVQCARCHDHKFDPFSQEDYYRLESFFAATQLEDRPIASFRRNSSRRAGASRPMKNRSSQSRSSWNEIEEPYKRRIRERKRAALERRFAAALEIAKDQRSEEPMRLAKEALAQIKPA